MFAIWNTPDKEKEETTVNLAATREISIDATVAAAAAAEEWMAFSP